MMCAYPGLGNILSWELGVSSLFYRRILQATILGIGVASLLIQVTRRTSRQSGGVGGRTFMLATLGAMLPLALGMVCVGDAFRDPRNFGPLLPSLLWCGVSIVWISTVARPRGSVLLTDSCDLGNDILLQRSLTLLGGLLAVQIWIGSPDHDDGSIHLSMRANQSFLVAALLVCSGIVTWRRGIVGLLSAVPWLYLSVLTTSRLIILIIPALAVLVPMSKVSGENRGCRPTLQRLLLGAAFVLLASAFVIAPIAQTNFPLPYLESAGNLAHRREWAARQGRVGRVFAALGLNLGPMDLPELQIAAASAAVPEDRFQLWASALNKIWNHPLGSGPQSSALTTHVRLPDGSGMGFSYSHPHNLFLELGMKLGWLAMLMTLLGSAGLLWMASLTIARTKSIAAACAAIGCIVELTRAQVSGDLWDTFGLLGGGILVSIMYAAAASNPPTTSAAPSPNPDAQKY
jgi:hypothetical protein